MKVNFSTNESSNTIVKAAKAKDYLVLNQPFDCNCGESSGIELYHPDTNECIRVAFCDFCATNSHFNTDEL